MRNKIPNTFSPLHRLSRLDHLRFYAATLLVFHHFRGPLKQPESINNFFDFVNIWVSKGQTGVTLFLVLSGFLFCIITKAGQRKINYFSFIRNRILRIFPLLILVFSVIITITRKTSTPMDILRILTLQFNTGNPDTGWGHEHFPIGPIWTIAVEFQFYLLFPFLSLILHNQGIKNMFGLVVIIILLKLGITIFSGVEIYYNIYHTITGRLDQFIIGIILGYYYNIGCFDFMHDKKNSQILLVLISITLLTLLMFNFKFNLFYNTLGFTIEAILWALILISYLTISFISLNIVSRTLSYLGNLSYSIYILHLPIGIITIKALAQLDITFESSTGYIVLIPVLIFSSLTYTFIERPFLLMKGKYLIN